ncbi:class I SAM-dependent methyltransferase [Halomarina pelagica]|uniref:class I SAM-dependent methyltransferase n=1 Tax=Halomarina pelagica TaxID=2961599 RepID=UPI0020C2CD8B|nr:class I SAM-dependent methyltransferase [Halomarina sp. BND7]
MTPQRRYEIDDFAFVGRTLAEYRRMFDLDVEALAGRRVLDCPAGPCSFVAEARDRGVRAVGVDAMYGRSPAALARLATEDAARATAALDGVEDLYRWEFYEDVAELETYRHRAASRFLRDYARHGGRYVGATLPELPFPDDAFETVLSAHLLFLYDDRLSPEFHLDTVRELLRVGEEVRVFPLHGFDAERSKLVAVVVDALRADGHAVETRTVPFEFQRGANEMLVVG